MGQEMKTLAEILKGKGLDPAPSPDCVDNLISLRIYYPDRTIGPHRCHPPTGLLILSEGGTLANFADRPDKLFQFSVDGLTRLPCSQTCNSRKEWIQKLIDAFG